MKDVVVIGAGKIGATVAGLLASTGDYQVTLADRSPEVLGNLDPDERIRIMAADVEDSLKLVDLLNGQFAVLNAAPFRLTKHIAETARAAVLDALLGALAIELHVKPDPAAAERRNQLSCDCTSLAVRFDQLSRREVITLVGGGAAVVLYLAV